tara:strand:+ start:326 stop:688 length:363 start_codon:yes stop_codon:yes gene_type:complete
MKGSLIWYAQRYSSLVILMYVAYLSYYFLTISGEVSYFEWTRFILSFQMRIFTTLVSILIVLHAFIGLWTVGTDYLTTRTLGFLSKSVAKVANIIRNSYYFIFIFLGSLYLIAILYMIWL